MGPGDMLDRGEEIKEEGGINVRLLVWVIGWMVRLFTEEKTKQGQIREPRVIRWPLDS